MQKLILSLSLATVATLIPWAALAMPTIGEFVGTDLDESKAALNAAGCVVYEIEREDGKIEADCRDTATGKDMEVYVDPASGAVVDIKAED